MKKTLLFIHGAGEQGPQKGSDHVLSILKRSIPANYQILQPLMPNPEWPRYHEWKETILATLSKVSGEVILAGHSLGSSILLKVLSEKTVGAHIRGCLLMATPFWGIDSDWQSEDFAFDHHFPSQLPKVPFFFYHSEDDEMVPLTHLFHYQQHLPQAYFRRLEGQGHYFNRGDFPEILMDLGLLNRI